MSDSNPPLTKRAQRLLYEMWAKKPADSAEWSEVESIAMANFELMEHHKLPVELFYSGKIVLVIPPELHARAVKAAGVLSLKEFSRRAILEAVERKEAEKRNRQPT